MCQFKEVEHGRLKLPLSAIEGGVDNILAQIFPQALNQVQIWRIRGKNEVV